MTDSRQTELSHIADWAAHNGWYRLIDASIAELTDNDLEYTGERSEFIKMISLINAFDYDDSDTIVELLAAFARIKKVSKPDASEEGKWQEAKRDIIYQLVVSKLRQSLFLTDDQTVDDANFDDPQIDIEQYRHTIIETFDELNLFSGSKKQRVYDVEVDSVTTVFFVKGHRKAFAKRKVQMFLEANETETFQRHTLDFIRDLLNDKFPSPVLSFSNRSSSSASSSVKRRPSVGQGENLTFAAVTSDDFLDTVAEVKTTRGSKKAKAAAAATVPVAPAAPSSPPPAAPRATAAAASAAKVPPPPSASKALVHNYKHASHEFKQKYDKTDPLRDILKAADQIESSAGSKRKGGPAAPTSVVLVGVQRRRTDGVTRSNTGSSSSSSGDVGVMNIEDESEDDIDASESSEEEPIVTKRSASSSSSSAAAASTPTASSTLNRLKNVLDDAQRKKFPTKLDNSPPPAARGSHARHTTQPAPANAVGYTSGPVISGPIRNGWTDEETKAFLAGVAAHGFGNWKEILNDNRYGPALINRTNINLKDRYRTLEKKGLL